jgi:hypothetical protein
MRCFLVEYLALKRIPILGPRGETGGLVTMSFREPDWKVAWVLVDFGTLIRLTPEQVSCSMEETPTIRVRDAEGMSSAWANGSSRANDLAVDADELLGYRILSSSDDEVGGAIKDLLVNLHSWSLKYLVVDNGERRVLLHTAWITGLAPGASSVIIDGLPSQSLRLAPAYPGVSALTPGYEDTIYRHYTHREFAANAE